MAVRDSKKRIVKDAAGIKYTFALRRLYCLQCKLLHTELPDFMLSNKHYTKAVIEGVKNNSIDYCAADDRTISRWKK